jgi:hypothetical protein
MDFGDIMAHFVACEGPIHKRASPGLIPSGFHMSFGVS